MEPDLTFFFYLLRPMLSNRNLPPSRFSDLLPYQHTAGQAFRGYFGALSRKKYGSQLE